MHTLKNVFKDLPDDARGREVFEEILHSGPVRIERIISAGQVSPDGFWYDQDEHEWVILLQGEARISFKDGSETTLKKGDHLLLNAHQQHRVSYTSTDPACIWLAVYWFGGS